MCARIATSFTDLPDHAGGVHPEIRHTGRNVERVGRQLKTDYSLGDGAPLAKISPMRVRSRAGLPLVA